MYDIQKYFQEADLELKYGHYEDDVCGNTPHILLII